MEISPALLAQSGVNSEHYMSLMYNGDHPITPIEIISNLAWGLGYCGMPHILVRFMAIKNEKELRKSSVIAIVWVSNFPYSCRSDRSESVVRTFFQ